jgi:3-hydroxyacyl-CoA dehydrogenase
VEIAGRALEQVAVIGTGFVGFGWTVVFARAGLEVRAHDADAGQLERLKERVADATTHLEQVGWPAGPDGGRIPERVRYFTDLDEALSGAGYVQESVPEDVVHKQAVFAEIDGRAPESVVIGSSTSGIPMTTIAKRVRHPERCVVVHPTNPPHIVPLVEIVPGERTAPTAVEFTRDLMVAVGQRPIVCRKEIAGFVLNRLQFALEREAFYLAREGVASVADIDRAVSDGLGLRWALLGPFLVEETNAESVRDDLEKFGPAIEDLFKGVCRPFAPLSARDIDRAEEGARELMADRTHDELIAYRDALVLRIRAMKDEWES